MKKIILSVDGMTCSACSSGLEKYLNKKNGVINASVNLVMASVTIDYDEKILNKDLLEKYINNAGFKSLGLFNELKERNKDKKEKNIFIIYSVISIILIYITLGHIFNFSFLPDNPKIYALSLFVISTVYLIYGFDILKGGYINLINKIPSMDTLVMIGVLSSYIYSVYSLYMILKGNDNYVNNLYFESSAIIIYFVKLGRFIDGISKNKTRDAIKKLVEITPNKANILIDGKEKLVTLDEIKKDIIVIAKPGEKIAVDGEIIKGKTHIDESFITGESKPVKKEKGDKVIAGSLNYDGLISYRAEKIGKESTISEIVRLVINASNTKSKTAKFADKLSGYFVPFVIVLAAIIFLIYLILGYNIKESLNTFITVLVVACPCSLGLATPLATIVGEGICASNGILIKKSEILEKISKAGYIVFDKTGILTYGNLKIKKIYNYSKLKESEIISLVASVEKYSTHPISKAFTYYINDKNIKLEKVKDIKIIQGEGITGIIHDDNIILGNNKILKKYNIKNKFLKDEEELKNDGCSIIYVVKNKEIIALIGVHDKIRDNAKEVIKSLSKKNIEVLMLTGDNEKTANKIAKELSIKKLYANINPKEKLKIINEIKQKNKLVIMCGDGINDSPALASADIGISIKNANDIAKDSADIILINNNLKSILDLLLISKKVEKKIKQNLFWAFFYNIFMIPIAAGLLKQIGISINPIIASIAMVLSSITVIINTLTIKKVGGKY